MSDAKQAKPRIAVHKFSSCDGCQLQFLNIGETILELTSLVDIIHFAEAGFVNEHAKVDIAFVEGSVSTPREKALIEEIRKSCTYLITIGACATAGGLQALRNNANVKEWVSGIYQHPEWIDTLDTATPISEHVKVDFEIWGCPVNVEQLLYVVKSLLIGIPPIIPHDSMCMDCKRRGNVCVIVAKGEPCLGPATKIGCGSVCPKVERGCYSCFGPSSVPNTTSLGELFKDLGMSDEEVARRFLMIYSHMPEFAKAGKHFYGKENTNS